MDSDDFARVIPGTGQVLSIGSNHVSAATVATGNGTLTDFSGTLENVPVAPSTLSFVAGSVTGTDNGYGVISGAGVSGTINYTTGAWSLTYTAAPANATAIAATYNYAVQSAPVGAQTYAVRLASTAYCHVEFGENPFALWPSMLLNPLTHGEYFKVQPGSKIAVIQDGSSTGILSIVEVAG